MCHYVCFTPARSVWTPLILLISIIANTHGGGNVDLILVVQGCSYQVRTGFGYICSFGGQ